MQDAMLGAVVAVAFLLFMFMAFTLGQMRENGRIKDGAWRSEPCPKCGYSKVYEKDRSNQEDDLEAERQRQMAAKRRQAFDAMMAYDVHTALKRKEVED